MRIKATRRTAESEIKVITDFSPRFTDIKKKIGTNIPFLNHMLEHVIQRGEFNLEIEVKLDEFYLTHVIFEDIGLTFGGAIRKFIEEGVNEGVRGYGFAYATIDEALSRCVISFENRAYLDFDASSISLPAEAENAYSEDLKTFFEGFVQGSSCTLHIDILKGENGHHIWEAVFRSFGEALHSAMEKREWRKGITAGVAGQINMDVEIE